MDQGKEEFVCLPSKKKKEDDLILEQAWKTIKAESRLRKMKMVAAAAAGNIKQTEEDADEFEELLQGTVLSPKESSTNNIPKGGIMKMNVEQASAAGNNQHEELVLSPKESSTKYNPKGQKRVREEEEEEEEDKDKEKKLKAADSLSSDTCSSNKFPPIDKFMDFDEDDEMWSSLGDL